MARTATVTFNDIINRRLETVLKPYIEAGINTDSLTAEIDAIAARIDETFKGFEVANADTLDDKKEFIGLERKVKAKVERIKNMPESEREAFKAHLLKVYNPELVKRFMPENV